MTRRPNNLVEPTAYSVSIQVVMDSLFVLMSFHGSVSRLWLILYSLGEQNDHTMSENMPL